MGWGLAIWIPLAGTVALVVLTIVPAALVTALKGRNDLFYWGFLTAGMTWFGGALSLAPADSGWAHRFYSEEQRGRAKLPFLRQRSRPTFAAWVAVAIALVVLVGAFVMRPTPVLGVDGDALGSSLPHRSEIFFFADALGPCDQVGDNRWSCEVFGPGMSGGTVPYDVRVGPLGCWRAAPEHRNWANYGEFTGCVSIVNYLWH